MRKAIENIKVSVIVPIYNSENYIRSCLESLIAQTLTNIEIILVNDGSTDNSIKNIVDLINKYDFIHLLEIENSGAAEARNRGMAIAQGDYISFVDNDDLVLPLFLEALYQECKNENLDIICGSFEASYKHKTLKKMKRRPELINMGVGVGDKLFKKQIQLRNYIPMIWVYMYRRKFLKENNLCFSVQTIHEDEEFTPRAWCAAKRAKVIENYYYIYQRGREGSIIESRDEKSVKDLEDILFSFVKYEEKLTDGTQEAFNYALLYILDHYVYYSRMIKQLDKPLIESVYYKMQKARILTSKQKIKYFLIRKITWLYYFLQDYKE